MKIKNIISIFLLTSGLLLSSCKKQNETYIVAVGFVQDETTVFNDKGYDEFKSIYRNFYFEQKDNNYDYSNYKSNNVKTIVEDKNIVLDLEYTGDMTFVYTLFLLSDGTYLRNPFYLDVNDLNVSLYDYDFKEDFEDIEVANNCLINFYGYYDGYRKSDDETTTITVYDENDNLLATREINSSDDIVFENINNPAVINVTYQDGKVDILNVEDNELIIRTVDSDNFIKYSYISFI